MAATGTFTAPGMWPRRRVPALQARVLRRGASVEQEHVGRVERRADVSRREAHAQLATRVE